MTSYFQIMVPMGQHERHGYGLLSVPGGDTGGKVSVYNAFYAAKSATVLSSCIVVNVKYLDFKSLKMSADFREEITVHRTVLAAKTWMSMNTGSEVNLCLTKHDHECEKKYPHSSDHRKMDLQTEFKVQVYIHNEKIGDTTNILDYCYNFFYSMRATIVAGSKL